MSGSNVCGTGGWNGPKPGDPDSFSILTATPAFGGIDLNWTMPLINPEAVAHTIIYRSTSPLENTAVRHVVASGNFFYDKTGNANPVRYYYWIQFVSVNGTYSALIGPATAIARPTIEQMIEMLTGLIDAGVLAQSLKTEIGRIELNKLGIDREMLLRAQNDAALGVSFNEVSAYSNATRALLQQEVLARTSANEAFVAAVNTLYAELGETISAVQSEQTALATAQESFASDTTTVQSSLAEDLASVQVGLQTNIDTTGELGALYTAKVDVNGLIGGFGVYNNGTIVEAGFDVDRFWVGRTTNKKKPFIIENDEVFIDQAAINKLTFSKLRDESGSFIVSNGRVKADYITIGNASIDTAHIKNASITTAKIGDLQVDTLKIKGNAVSVPGGMTAYGSMPSMAVTLDEPGFIFVMVTANYLSPSAPEASAYLTAYCAAQVGITVGISMPQSYSGASTAFGTFWMPAGTHVCRGVYNIIGGTRNLGATGIYAVGVKK
jgi:hypothetical protein